MTAAAAFSGPDRPLRAASMAGPSVFRSAPRWLFALLLAGATSALAKDEVRLAEVREVPLERPVAARGASHELRLALYTFQGGRWSPDEIVPAVRAAAVLVAQCGVVLARADLHVLEAPRRFHLYFTPVSRERLRQTRVARPAVFFVDDTRNRPAYDAEAIGRSNAAARPELADTVWIAHGARDLPQALAHELVHVLADNGAHSRELGNLMRPETSPRNINLTPAQCAQLRTQGEANGLLRSMKSS